MKLVQHFKKYMLSGALAIIPVVLVYLLVRFLYLSVDSNILNLVDKTLGFRIPGMGIIIMLLILYALGLFASNLAGKWFFPRVEWITEKIPLIRTTYQVGKQLSSSLSLPEKKVFKKAVLVNYLKPDIYTVGFVTGSVIS